MTTISHKIRSLLEPCSSCGPAPQEQIEAAQCELNLKFPPSYRVFLEEYGAAFGDTCEIAGLMPSHPGEAPAWTDVLTATLSDRRLGALPDDSIFISTDGAGLSYFLRCSRTDPTLEGEVIEWGADHGGGTAYAKDFVSFLEVRLSSRGNRQ